MASKSANYCAFPMSGGEGLLLLCEAQLGNPLYQCKESDPAAAKNCLATVENPSLQCWSIGKDCNTRARVIYSPRKLTSPSRTRPNKFVDAKVLSPDLAGVMMVSADSTTQHLNVSGLILEYDEVRWHFARSTCVVHCIWRFAGENSVPF